MKNIYKCCNCGQTCKEPHYFSRKELIEGIIYCDKCTQDIENEEDTIKGPFDHEYSKEEYGFCGFDDDDEYIDEEEY